MYRVEEGEKRKLRQTNQNLSHNTRMEIKKGLFSALFTCLYTLHRVTHIRLAEKNRKPAKRVVVISEQIIFFFRNKLSKKKEKDQAKFFLRNVQVMGKRTERKSAEDRVSQKGERGSGRGG